MSAKIAPVAPAETAKRTTHQKLKKVAQWLYRHENGTYYMKRRIGGIKKVLSLETSDRKLADGKLTALTKSEQAREGGEMTLAEVCRMAWTVQSGDDSQKGWDDIWVPVKKGRLPEKRKKETGTIRNLKWIFRSLKKGKLWDQPVHKIAPVEYQVHVSTMKTNKNGLSVQSQKDALNHIGRILEFAVSAKCLEENPIPKLPKIKRKKNEKLSPEEEQKQKAKKKIPTEEEFSKIIDYIRNEEDAPMREQNADFLEFYCLASVGEAETINLDWSDFDWNRKRINFGRVKTVNPFYVPFYPWLEPFVLNLWEKAGKPVKGTVFPDRGVKVPIRRACKALGIAPTYTPRQFRKMGIVRQYKAGLPIKMISKFQGHRDGGKLIMQVYTDVFSENDEAYEQATIANLKFEGKKTVEL